MSNNTYTVAYAVGYYYGRAFPEDSYENMPPVDITLKDTQGFRDGLAAGRHDFEVIDLTTQALAEKEVDPDTN